MKLCTLKNVSTRDLVVVLENSNKILAKTTFVRKSWDMISTPQTCYMTLANVKRRVPEAK